MRTLLLADDNVTTQRLITLSFAEDASFRVVTVADGQQAIDYIKLHQPDILLAATTVAQVNGYDLAAFIRSRPSTRHLPVLLLIGAFEGVDNARLQSCGANGMVEKPLDPASLIKRVKELLTGSAAAPIAAMAVRAEPEPAPAAAAPKAAPAARNRKDYLDSLGAAFDSLDQQLEGRIDTAAAAPVSRTVAPPPAAGPVAAVPDENPIFEVDVNWFGDDSREERLRDGARTEPHASTEAASAGNALTPVYEVDDDWFLEDQRARAEKRLDQQQLAAEMGIHEVELPEVEAAPNTAAPAEGLDFDFGLEDLLPAAGRTARKPDPDSPFASPSPRPLAVPPVEARSPILFTPPAPPHNRRVSDDFVALLAQEQRGDVEVESTAPSSGGAQAGDTAAALPLPPQPPARPQPPAQPVARGVELDEAGFNAIAAQVAQRLATGPLADRINEAITAAVRETVRTTVSETSERLVRDEITRIKEGAAGRGSES